MIGLRKNLTLKQPIWAVCDIETGIDIAWFFDEQDANDYIKWMTYGRPKAA